MDPLRVRVLGGLVAGGHDATLDPRSLPVVGAVIQPQADLLKASGMVGGEVRGPPDASPQTRLLRALGRSA